MKKWIGESALSLFFLGIGIVFWATAPRLEETGGAGTFGPAHFPKMLSALLVLLAGINLFRVISKRAGNDGRLAFSFKTAAGAILCALYVYLIPVWGYFYATPVFAVCLLLLLGYRNPLRVFLVSAGFTLMAYVVFYRLLAVALPV